MLKGGRNTLPVPSMPCPCCHSLVGPRVSHAGCPTLGAGSRNTLCIAPRLWDPRIALASPGRSFWPEPWALPLSSHPLLHLPEGFPAPLLSTMAVHHICWLFSLRLSLNSTIPGIYSPLSHRRAGRHPSAKRQEQEEENRFPSSLEKLLPFGSFVCKHDLPRSRSLTSNGPSTSQDAVDKLILMPHLPPDQFRHPNDLWLHSLKLESFLWGEEGNMVQTRGKIQEQSSKGQPSIPGQG